MAITFESMLTKERITTMEAEFYYDGISRGWFHSRNIAGDSAGESGHAFVGPGSSLMMVVGGNSREGKLGLIINSDSVLWALISDYYKAQGRTQLAHGCLELAFAKIQTDDQAELAYLRWYIANRFMDFDECYRALGLYGLALKYFSDEHPGSEEEVILQTYLENYSCE